MTLSYSTIGSCALALLLSLTILTFRTRRRLSALGEPAPQAPSFLPFGVDIIARTIYETSRHRDLDSWHKFFAPHGPECQTVQASLLGLRCIFTHDPANIKAILATQFDDYGKGSQFHDDWKPFLGDSIFTTDGPQWRSSRQLIRPMFIKDRVSDLSIFENHMQDLFNCIQSHGNGAKIDISSLFLRYTLDTGTDFLLGESVGSLINPSDEFAKAFAEVQRIQNLITKAGPANIFIPRGSYRAALKIINDFVNPFIQQALAMRQKDELTREDKFTFLQALAEMTQDPKILRDQIVAVLLASRDTTASALSWTFFELAKYPEIVGKLRKEILATVGPDRCPTYKDLKDMKYLQNVLNETLRIYPSIPFNLRVALRDTSLPSGGGRSGTLPVAVLKNTMVAYSVLAMHRRQRLQSSDSDSCPDPRTFDPDRWYGKPPTPWTYLPFNGGPRACIGQQFALTEMGYSITRILQRFQRVENFTDPQQRGSVDVDWNLKAEIVLQPKDGVDIGLWKADLKDLGSESWGFF